MVYEQRMIVVRTYINKDINYVYKKRLVKSSMDELG